jgi:hypothetical protein
MNWSQGTIDNIKLLLLSDYSATKDHYKYFENLNHRENFHLRHKGSQLASIYVHIFFKVRQP